MTEIFPCTAERIISYPLVLLHGWGFDRQIWEDAIPLLQQFFDVMTIDLPGFGDHREAATDVDVVAIQLFAQLPEKSILLGWSLGGLVAIRMAIRFPQRVHALITAASNLKWVSDGEWPGASADNFAAFFENLAKNFEGTKQHFCGVIARGDVREKQLTRILRNRLSDAPKENFMQGLRLLGNIDNRQDFSSLAVPGLHVFGERDAMIPLAAGQQMCALNKKQQTVVFPGAAHAPFLSEPEWFLNEVKEFILTLPYRLDKKRIAESFSRAAVTYDDAAQLQREIGDQMFAFLPAGVPEVVLDLGCGTGVYSQRLRQRFPMAQIISLDIATGMLKFAGKNRQLFCGVCADAESLPFKNDSVDLLFSNLTIQWCQHLPLLFAEMFRVLKPGACCVLSTFAEGTLQELREAWKAVDDAIHVNRFSAMSELQSAACQAGFSDVQTHENRIIRYYDSVNALTRELKAIGAHNLNQGCVSGLVGKNRLQRFAESYEIFRQGAKLPATYHTLFLILIR